MNRQFIELRKTLGKFISNFSVEKTEDGKEIIFDGEEVYEGLEVNTYDEKGEIVALADGEYKIMEERVKVVDGKVTEILKEEKKTSEKKLDFSAQRQEAEKSYGEKERAIQSEVVKIHEDAWITEASDAYAVAVIYDETTGENRFLRYDVKWNEDGSVSLDGEVEVVQEFVAKDEDREVETLRAENDDLRRQIADLKAQPMATPVPQRTEMSKVKAGVHDNVKGTKFERVCKIFNS